MHLKFNSSENLQLKNLILTNIFLGIVNLVFSPNITISIIYIFTALMLLVDQRRQLIISDQTIELNLKESEYDKLGLMALLGRPKLDLKKIAYLKIDPDKLILGDLANNKIELKKTMFSDYQFREILTEIIDRNPVLIVEENIKEFLKSSQVELFTNSKDLRTKFLLGFNLLASVYLVLNVIARF